MSVYRPTYRDQKTGKMVTSRIWWYEFSFAGKRVRESAKTHLKTLAKDAETNRRRQLEEGFNGLADRREERIRTVKELADSYLDGYKLRHKSVVFAQYALGHVKRLVGEIMTIDASEETVKSYQSARLKEKASAKSINEEVCFLLRLLGDAGESIRGRMRRAKTLKLKVGVGVGLAYTPEQKAALLKAAKESRSPAIYPALVLALNAGLRDAEIRGLQWERVDLIRAILTVGDSKTDAGSGRTIPLNSTLLKALKEHAQWYTSKFKTIEPGWYVFPYGKPYPRDPKKPTVSLKTAWRTVRKAAGVTGRWHDNRHTLITDLCESGAGEETIRDIAGHVSQRMVRHYSHIRMQAKSTALESIVPKETKPAETQQPAPIPETVPKETPKVSTVN